MNHKVRRSKKRIEKIQPPALRPYLALTLWQEFLKRKKGGIKKMKKPVLSSWFLVLGFLVLGPLSVVRGSLFAQSPQVPHLLNFQSVLTDAAGVPLPDGTYEVDFRIVDAAGEEFYAETQTLETSQGVASAMVGAQGSLDLPQLDPQTPKFLRVQVEGQGPSRQMEIVTVPYALYAQQALGAAPQSIGGEAIRPGAITAEHLAEDALDTLLGDIRSNLFYSQGTSVPTVLRDLDVAIQQRQVNLNNVQTVLQSQINTVNASVSASQSDTDSRLAVAEQNIDTLMAAPRVAAAGIVFMPDPYTANLEWGYNIANVEGVAFSTRINFQNAVSTPYVVQLTRAETGGVGGTPFLSSTNSASLLVGVESTGDARFHFVVFK